MSTSMMPLARLRYTVAEAAQLLSISERQVWRLVAGGKLRSHREGRRIFIPRAEIEPIASATSDWTPLHVVGKKRAKT